MDERGIRARRPAPSPRVARSALVFLAALALQPTVAVRSARGAVTLVASRPELLYSTDNDPDCSKLVNISDAALPFNITRLHAIVDGAPAGAALTYHWSMPKGNVGTPAADLDLGPGEQTSAIDGMCADFGNSCVLVGKKLTFYDHDSLLYLAPKCDALPADTSRQFRGGSVRFRVKVTAGRRKVGQASAKIGFGHNGSVKLFAWNGDLRQANLSAILVLKDGLGSKTPVGVPLNVVFGAVPVAPVPAPGPIESFVFTNNGGGTAEVPFGCDVATSPNVPVCAEVDYLSGGKFVPTVAAKFADGSALCDNMTVQVLTCSGNLKLDVNAKPKRATYDPADPRKSNVEVVVRVINASRPTATLPACGFLLRGANVLTCAESLKVGTIADEKTTSFDLPHCSATVDQPCTSDAQCSPVSQGPGFPAPCPECDAGETCLTQPHCSATVTRTCGNDADCDNTGAGARCPNCKADERCVRILNFNPEITLNPGDSMILLDQPVTLRNVFGDTAKMVDTWTVTTTLNTVTATDTVKYRIRGRPQ